MPAKRVAEPGNPGHLCNLRPTTRDCPTSALVSGPLKPHIVTSRRVSSLRPNGGGSLVSTSVTTYRTYKAPFASGGITGLGWAEFFQRLGDGTLSPLHRELSSNLVPD